MVEPHIEGFVKLCPFWHTPYCSETELRQVQKMYAIIQTGGKQYKVQVGDFVEIEKLDAEVGAKVVFDTVLAVGEEGGKLNVGTPTVANATVEAEIADQFRGKKIVVFKMKRRKSYRRTYGHRQSITRVKINAINA